MDKELKEIKSKLRKFELSNKSNEKQIRDIDKKFETDIEDIQKDFESFRNNENDELRDIIRETMEDILGDLTAIREYNEDNIFN